MNSRIAPALLRIQKELPKKPTTANKAFDLTVRGALREEATKKGIEVPGKP